MRLMDRLYRYKLVVLLVAPMVSTGTVILAAEGMGAINSGEVFAAITVVAAITLMILKREVDRVMGIIDRVPPAKWFDDIINMGDKINGRLDDVSSNLSTVDARLAVVEYSLGIREMKKG